MHLRLFVSFWSFAAYAATMTDAAASKSTAAVAIAAIVLPEMLLRKLVVPSGCTKDIRNFVALLYFSLFDSSIVIFNYNVLAKWRPKNNSWVYSTVGSCQLFCTLFSRNDANIYFRLSFYLSLFLHLDIIRRPSCLRRHLKFFARMFRL